MRVAVFLLTLLVAEPDDDKVDRLIKHLQSGSQAEREDAFKELGTLGDKARKALPELAVIAVSRRYRGSIIPPTQALDTIKKISPDHYKAVGMLSSPGPGEQAKGLAALLPLGEQAKDFGPVLLVFLRAENRNNSGTLSSKEFLADKPQRDGVRVMAASTVAFLFPADVECGKELEQLATAFLKIESPDDDRIALAKVFSVVGAAQPKIKESFYPYLLQASKNKSFSVRDAAATALEKLKKD